MLLLLNKLVSSLFLHLDDVIQARYFPRPTDYQNFKNHCVSNFSLENGIMTNDFFSSSC